MARFALTDAVSDLFPGRRPFFLAADCCRYRHRPGVAMVLVVVLGGILLMVGIALHTLSGRQRESLELMTNAEVAHLLAEAGIESSLRSVRTAMARAGIGGGGRDPLAELLLTAGPRADVSLMAALEDNWNAELEAYARELDPSAKVRVEVWLRGFQQTELDPTAWVDPTAKEGFLSIESTGAYRGSKRTLSVRRRVWVSSVLPPVYSRFTLHVKDAARGNPGRFNVIKNDYHSQITNGPRPLICYHQATPELPWGTADDAREPDIGSRRGQVFLGGGPVRLHLTSGAGTWGEIFQLYDVTNPGTFRALKFKTPVNRLPPAIRDDKALTMVRDDSTDASMPKMGQFRFGHAFIYEGFHDQSDRMPENAMYEGNILSARDKSMYGAKSAMLHLFGDGRPGYRSHTRVYGQVNAAFIRFGQLEVNPNDPDSKESLDKLRPPPLYLLPSLTDDRFAPDLVINEFLKRRWKGPVVLARQLFASHAEYQSMMSTIVEMPYMTGYNTMAEIAAGKSDRQFPPAANIFGEDRGEAIKVEQGGVVLYEGPADPGKAMAVIDRRIQREVSTIEALKTEVDPKKTGEFRLGGVVRVKNDEGVDLVLPPRGMAPPLKVVSGGMIVLEKGNVVLRGVTVANPGEALTIVMKAGTRVMVESAAANAVNIVAPKAGIVAFGTPVKVLGALALGDVNPADVVHGGVVQFRPEQDPIRTNAAAFRKIALAEGDAYWHE